MIIVYPDFYPSFQCAASACRHSCCKDWEIDIDVDSYEWYRQIDGTFGARLRESVCAEPAPHFLLREDGSCPFLREDGLCDMILELGEECLCGICAEHPRFYNEFPGRLEAGLGLCCEEAVRLLLEGSEPLRLVEVPEPDEAKHDEKTDRNGISEISTEIAEYEETGRKTELKPELKSEPKPEPGIKTGTEPEKRRKPAEPEQTEKIIRKRAELFSVLSDPAEPLISRMEKAAASAGIPTDRCSLFRGADLRETVSFYLTLETLDAGWRPLLEQLKNFSGEIAFPEGIRYERLLEYFIYRHFAAGETEEDRRTRLLFAFQSVILISALEQAVPSVSLPELVRMYSSEIEYSDENVDAVLKYTSRYTG